ncbi:serine hydrolase [Rhizocola hellebori]|uniref:Serine hydrolase n=1 Tax=Rhizocola hellebori TaxID=1392758 RepID=A0A8J3Q5Q5_9ACTN|nr:serine hydrolase [Rhizocola hellebori]GIH03772.1 serine hydrolase [Rhizocola hellebori]
MTVSDLFDALGVGGAAYAAPIGGGSGVGVRENDLVTPASVMKIQVALAAGEAIAAGVLDGTQQRVLAAGLRTPGQVGISLLRDDVSMSVRDLIPQMLTISDNVATDELIALVGLERINELTGALGLTRTQITEDLRSTLDTMAKEVGFADYPAFADHDSAAGPPSLAELRLRLHGSAALDPARGSRTTAAETVRLLQAIWTGEGVSEAAAQGVRQAMESQLTRHRIASGFGPQVAVAAKTGGLMGLVRNEAGVVTLPTGQRYAVAVFTRCEPAATIDPARIDAGIGTIARALVDELQ